MGVLGFWFFLFAYCTPSVSVFISQFYFPLNSYVLDEDTVESDLRSRWELVNLIRCRGEGKGLRLLLCFAFVH